MDALIPIHQINLNENGMKAYIRAFSGIHGAAGQNAVPNWAKIEAAFDVMPARPNNTTDYVLLFISSIAKRGNVTSRWCRKRAQAIGLENNRDFTLERDDTRDCWARFGSKIDINEQAWINDWEHFAAAGNNNYLILRNIIDQSRYTGLASLKIASDGYNDFPDFPWQALEAITGEGVIAAEANVNGHPWAGLANDTQFLRNLARADLFKHAVYVAKQLNKRVLGKETLDDLKTNTEGMRHKTTCDQWITAYVNGMRSQCTRAMHRAPLVIGWFRALWPPSESTGNPSCVQHLCYSI